MYDIRNLNIWKKEPETKKESSELREINIADLSLSVRSYNCLKRAGCSTVGDILGMIGEDEHGLLKIRNLGARSETEILDCVRKLKEEYEKAGQAAKNNSASAQARANIPARPRVVIRTVLKPSERWWDTEIEEFHLSEEALAGLRRTGIRRVRDLYTAGPVNEPGWFAVRELLEKIPEEREVLEDGR